MLSLPLLLCNGDVVFVIVIIIIIINIAIAIIVIRTSVLLSVLSHYGNAVVIIVIII